VRTLTHVTARLGSGGRLLGVDVARSLALFGMMSVHIFFPAFRPDGSMIPAYAIAAGRSAALFATLAGVGIALASGGSTPYAGVRLRGARAGDTCSATEFCAYEPPQLCGRADAQSFCAPRPEECIELYAPVCGCDQRTYENSCFANAAGTGIYTAGECVEQR